MEHGAAGRAIRAVHDDGREGTLAGRRTTGGTTRCFDNYSLHKQGERVSPTKFDVARMRLSRIARKFGSLPSSSRLTFCDVPVARSECRHAPAPAPAGRRPTNV